MIKNYFLTAFRYIKKTKFYSFINVLGLAAGMAACLMILHYINYEKGYDRFIENNERIFRLRYERTDGEGKSVRFASCCPPAAARIRGNYPEIEKIGRILRYQAIVSHGDTKFLEDRMYFAEPEFFEVLKFSFISGNPIEGLGKPNHTYISQSTARRYFGKQNPLGKTLSVDKKTDYQIRGIFKDIPENSHLKMDIILPWKNLESQFGPEYYEAWGHTGSYTYLTIRPGTDPRVFEDKLQALVKAEVPWLKEYKMTIDLIMQPLTDIHLNSHFMQEYEVNGNLDTVNFLNLIAFFIIFMAWINYTNLSTARSLRRAREIGIRKVMGSSRWQLRIQFFMETVLINFFAIFLAFVILQSMLPPFSKLTGIPQNFSIWTQSWFWPAIVLLFVAGVFLSGFYPIMAMSAFEPVKVLKGKVGTSKSEINLRKFLVIFQYAIALALIIATITIFQQIAFMRNQDLGFEINQILVVRAPRIRNESFQENYQSFKNTLLAQASITGISFVTEVPGRQIYWDNGGIRKAGEPRSKGKNYQIVGVDYDFADLFEIKFVQGRNFSKKFPADKDALILNETAVRWMGFKSPEEALGKQVDYWDKIYPIIGVIKDYHQQSPKEEFEPHIYRYMPHGRGIRGVFALKINSRAIKETIVRIKQEYDLLFPGNPFEYFFLDDYFNQQYKADQLLGNVFTLFSGLAILITALGILGLSAFSASQRIREIAIRKVMGASVSKILSLILKDFIYLLTISFLLILPLMFFGLNHWLNGFALRMKLNGFILILPYFFVFFITLTTVISMTVKAASTNPVKTLKYE